MKLWEEFYDYAKPSLPGAPNALLDLYLRAAAIDFFKNTEVMTADEFLVMDANWAVYQTNNPPLTDTTRVLEFELANGKTLTPLTRLELQQQTQSWALRKGEPSHYFQLSPRRIRVYPIPEQEYTATISMVLQPTRDSVGVEDEYFDEYVETIANGAISRMTRIPQKPWTNMELAAAMGVVFQADIRNARIETYRGFTNADLQVQFNKIV